LWHAVGFLPPIAMARGAVQKETGSVLEAGLLGDCIAEAIAEVEGPQPTDAEGWKRRGGEAYQKKHWKEAVRCYTAALSHCDPAEDLALVCLNNRAACSSQLKDYEAVISDASTVIEQQPANLKALLRRMVAFDASGLAEEALTDAGSVLTMEPKNAHALQVVSKKRASLTKKANEAVPRWTERQSLSVFVFTEDCPLQCYCSLLSLQRHVKGAALQIHIFWKASAAACKHSYLLLQTLPDISPGNVHWIETSKEQLFPSFTRLINRMAVEGQQHVLLLSDRVLFHTDVDASIALKVLSERREAFSVRLDLNPRIEHFPEADLFQSAPNLQHFAEDPRVLLWKRSYDKSKQAYEAVPRELGWDAILDWTATIVRTENVKHFFSALLPPLNTFEELDAKAADWLSRRQRMKRSELAHRSACFEDPVLIAVARSDLGDTADLDRCLRSHLLKKFAPEGQGGDRFGRLASRIGWTVKEAEEYFAGVDTAAADEPRLQGLFRPELFKTQYHSAVQVAALPSPLSLPKPLTAPRPLVTWLVPVHNAEFFVQSCFESILGQSGFGAGYCEVVFVEDCSDDGTLSALRKLASASPVVRLLENETRLGVAGSLARGWQHCLGDFVARLDADDEAEPERLLRQLRYMEQHKSLSLVGSRARSFWTETRKFTIERATEKSDGTMTLVAWREFHGDQNTRQREQLTLCERDGRILVSNGPAELQRCRVLQVGEESMFLKPESWKVALRAAQGGHGEVLVERRDPLEPPCGPRVFHPMLVRSNAIFEDSVLGTTATFRSAHFAQGGCPFPQEEAESHWAWIGLGAKQHAANLADPLVRMRRHEGNRAARDPSGIHESQCAAVREHLARTYKLKVDLKDAAALLNFRGPQTSEQGQRLLHELRSVAASLIAQVRPAVPNTGDEFWSDFLRGKEAALEHAIWSKGMRFKKLVDEVSRAITDGEKSPRQHRSRTPPR